MKLAGRVAVVTDGGSGIGRAMVEACARARATVVVAGIGENVAAAVASSVGVRGGEALGIRSGLGVYNASKYAVVGLSETLAKELRQGLEALRRRHERLEQALLQPKA